MSKFFGITLNQASTHGNLQKDNQVKGIMVGRKNQLPQKKKKNAAGKSSLPLLS